MKIAITGLSGFLGHYVAKKLFERGVQMRALVRSTSNISHLSEYGEKITFVQGDLGNKEALREFVEGADIVIHMAYERNGAGFHASAQNDISRLLDVNLTGSLELLDAAKQQGVKQFIFTSSCAVYGHIFPDIKLDELHPLMPDSNYGAYKASVEAFCHSYFLSKSINTTMFRPVGIYGIDPKLSNSEWYDLVKNIKNGVDVEVVGGGKIVDVTDVAYAIDSAIDNKNAFGKVYNLSDFYIDNLSIAEMAKEICNSKSKISGTPKKPKNSIDNTESRALGVHYAGTDSLRQYIQVLVGLI
ncbi:MAG: NAD(P)-dependent oxidoreductase [Candidatus Scalindua sp.]|jgi:nucleoside-diphosphate-sugar epimerase|nr:NAD(P)-dependent oxidoreductase [Candidatus Scalindua sp.]MBT5303640.1 NAD(P)-dependent oxidoreductase [Candidatus Scalindua sp.]MBT6227474.1 NAD(P)-dependent oxidoreductase [Candidatus Scalindua sp.]MBT6564138.1 NAD(P)-dependent oxidoreductase [Candidatus Scalindua sp.]MBT7210715.1 NAD(P)-dependent oxidoreductase [Candidatus Scalindua sp.]